MLLKPPCDSLNFLGFLVCVRVIKFFIWLFRKVVELNLLTSLFGLWIQACIIHLSCWYWKEKVGLFHWYKVLEVCFLVSHRNYFVQGLYFHGNSWVLASDTVAKVEISVAPGVIILLEIVIVYRNLYCGVIFSYISSILVFIHFPYFSHYFSYFLNFVLFRWRTLGQGQGFGGSLATFSLLFGEWMVLWSDMVLLGIEW